MNDKPGQVALTVGQLAARLLAHPDQGALVCNAHLFRDNLTIAVLPVVWTAEKDGKFLLLDRDVFQALVAAKTDSN